MPLIGRELIPWLRLGHGLYNSLVIILFFNHARLGLVIRHRRRKNAPLPLDTIRSHRKAGPVLAILGITGFFLGLTVISLDQRNYLEYWPHLLTGLAIAVLLALTYYLSRKIKGPVSPWRTAHFAIGAFILCLYLFEAFLGVGILF